MTISNFTYPSPALHERLHVKWRETINYLMLLRQVRLPCRASRQSPKVPTSSYIFKVLNGNFYRAFFAHALASTLVVSVSIVHWRPHTSTKDAALACQSARERLDPIFLTLFSHTMKACSIQVTKLFGSIAKRSSPCTHVALCLW